MKTRAVWLTLDGDQLGDARTARRWHGTLSYTWSTFQQGTDVKVCVKFREDQPPRLRLDEVRRQLGLI